MKSKTLIIKLAVTSLFESLLLSRFWEMCGNFIFYPTFAYLAFSSACLWADVFPRKKSFHILVGADSAKLPNEA